MSSTISYQADTEEWVFAFPSVTVTQAHMPSAFGYARMSTKYLYTVRSVLIADSAEDLELKKAAATEILGAPRGTFRWMVDANTIIQWAPTHDTNWGPHPISLSFDKFFGVHTALVTWQLAVEVSANPEDEILDLVYSCSHSVDKNFMTQRIISGVLRMNGAKFDPITFQSADAYRSTVEDYVCTVPPGWQRTAQHFQMATDGLTLSFHIVDEQKFAVLPEDITDGEASLSVSGNPRYGRKRDFTVEGWFESTIDKPRAPRAAFVALAQSLFNMQIDDESFNVKDLSVRQEVYRPRLYFRMTWDAWSPEEPNSLPGSTEAERRANWMLMLMTRADNWLATFKGGEAANPGVYGTTDVAGWCGSATIAPSLNGGNSTRRQNAPGADSANNLTVEDESQAAVGEEYFYEMTQSFKYAIDFGVKIHPYKDTAKQALAQQIQAIATYVMVCGRIRQKMVQDEDTPTIPAPPYTNEDAWLLKKWIDTEEIKDGREYIVEWKYLLRLKGTADPTNVLVPYSPFVPPELFDVVGDEETKRKPSKNLPNTPFTNDFTVEE